MVNSYIDDPVDKYFIFFKDLNFEEVEKEDFNKFEKYLNGKLIYFKVHKNNVGAIPSIYEGYFPHSDYSFYDYKNQKIMVSEGGFLLWSIREKKDRSRRTVYHILDCKNRSREFLTQIAAIRL